MRFLWTDDRQTINCFAIVDQLTDRRLIIALVAFSPVSHFSQQQQHQIYLVMLRWTNNAIGRNATVTFLSLLIVALTVSAATATAEVTMPSTANGNLGQLAISAVMGESAVVDKETGRIFWEGGSSNTLVESIAPKLRSAVGGIPHIKATILSVLLLLVAAGTLSQLLRDWIKSMRYTQTTLLTVTTHALLLLPKAPRWFIVLVLTLYLLEAYTCSTHQYLRHVVDDAETYIEQLREQLPEVEWKVRSFHFENYMLFPFEKLRHFLVHHDGNHHPTPTTFPSIFHWKRVTHSATACYNYTSCTDQTIVGVWKRAPIVMNYHPPSSEDDVSLPRTNMDRRNHNNATTATTGNTSNEGATTTSHKAAKAIPTIMKIVITKTLLLRDSKTRQDYFTQQKAFLQSHKHRDEYAEFSTNVYMNNYRNGSALPSSSSRILALSHAQQPQWLIHRYTYWFWTCLGLTVPYRRWLASQCDEVRVRVVKETSMDHGPNQLAISSSTTTDRIKKKHWFYHRPTTTSTVPS